VQVDIAATRPVQRDSGMPDFAAGARLILDDWTGVQTGAATGTRISSLSIAASGLLRHVAVNDFSASPKRTNDLAMTAFALDAFLPIIPGSKGHMGNSLSLTGEIRGWVRIRGHVHQPDGRRFFRRAAQSAER
jgi:hypothetical protein